MDICISILILLAETLMILMYMHISFNKKIRFDKYVIGVLLISCAIYLMINNKIIPQLCGALVYAVILLYCYKKFKLTVGRTILRFLFGFVISLMSEIVIACIAIPLSFIQNDNIVLCLLNIISLVIVTSIYFVSVIYVKRIKYLVFRNLFIRLVLLGIIFAGVLFNYYENNGHINIYTVIIMAFAVVVFAYTYMLEQSKKEIEIKNLELELQEVYGRAYKELLTEVRKRQHDFKNQLGAIYSMHLVASSLDELVSMQNEYGNKLLDGCKYDSILTSCDNSVLSGYIYYRCIACEKEGIEVQHDIHMGNVEGSLALHEIIEVLGILIDNAYEYILTENTEVKCIKLDLLESESEIKFVISNPAEYLTCMEIENLFKHGYSTKGKNRGIGLARVLELSKEHNIELRVRNYTEKDCNWIEFALVEIK